MVPLALERVNEIADYIAGNSVEAARVWLMDNLWRSRQTERISRIRQGCARTEAPEHPRVDL
jgi:hypothetical protein